MEFNGWSLELLDSISTGICILDKNYRVVFWNDFMQFYTGVDKDTILGHQVEEFFPEFGREIYREGIDLIFKGWPPLFYASRLNRLFHIAKEGRPSPMEYQDVTITSVTADSADEYHALITVNDVTDLNRKLEERNILYRTAQDEILKRTSIEEKLRYSESRLRDSNEIKDRILAIIGHDLRSPISTSINGLEALLDNYADISDETKRDLLVLLLRGTREALNLLEDLLAWARNNSQGYKLQKTVFRISEMLERETGKLLPLAAEKGINLTLGSVQDAEVVADLNMIKTVLRNLVSNAIKFTAKGGNIYISSEIEGKQACICVRDTGVGMEARIVEKLFSPGELVSTRGTNNEKGSGFGLIVTKEFISKNDGTLSVESVPGEGSTFRFTLPLA